MRTNYRTAMFVPYRRDNTSRESSVVRVLRACRMAAPQVVYMLISVACEMTGGHSVLCSIISLCKAKLSATMGQ